MLTQFLRHFFYIIETEFITSNGQYGKGDNNLSLKEKELIGRTLTLAPSPCQAVNRETIP